MRSEIQNKSVHAVATSLVFDRVQHSPDFGHQRNLANCNMKELITPTDAESAETKDRYKILLARILCALPAFRFLSDLVPPDLPVQYRDEMSTRSDVIPLPVLMKDEKSEAKAYGPHSPTHSLCKTQNTEGGPHLAVKQVAVKDANKGIFCIC